MSLRGFAAAALLVAATLASGASPGADTVDEALRLLEAGRAAAALERIEAVLARTPDDLRARFARAQLLARQGRRAEAIEAYIALTEARPDLPEPHNNLAALYAEEGRYERALESLEAAVRARPDYATAHENLGDVHLRLAERAYARAAEVAPGSASVRAKLRLARELLATPPR